MREIKHAILLGIALVYGLGIFAAFKTGLNPVALSLVGLLLTFGAWLSAWKSAENRGKSVLFPLLVAGFYGVGILSFWVRLQSADDQLLNLGGKTVTLTASARDNAQIREKGAKIWMRVEKLQCGTYTWEGSSDLLVYLKPGMEFPAAGEQFILTGKIDTLSGHHMEWGSWAWRQGISACLFASESRKSGNSGGVEAALLRLRNSVASKFRTHMPDSEMAGLAIAMLLGDRGGLEQDLKAEYSATGASHILSISGLHVAIVFEFLLVALFFVLPARMGWNVRACIALAFVGVFGLMSGGCPPVMRAVFMIALVVFARMASLRVNMANLLGFTALVFMVANPFVLLDVGFQLSFLAVLGLIVAGPAVKKWSRAHFTGAPDFVHEINSASLAAQVFTLPLILIYFGQFPTYFLLANLLMLPVADWIIKIGFAGVLLCFVPVVNELVFRVLDLLLWLMSWICGLIAHAPGAVTTSVSLGDAGFRMLVLMAGLTVWWMWRKKNKMALAEATK